MKTYTTYEDFIQSLNELSKIMLSVIFLIAAFLHCNSLQAAEVHVDAANATGIEDGSITYPFNTITEGLDVAQRGDDVLVGAGIYYGTIELRDDIRLISKFGAEVTIIDGMGNTAAVNSPNEEEREDDFPNSYIEGFTIREANNLISVQNRYQFWSTSSIEIHNCILEGGNVLWRRGVSIAPRVNALITRTLFKNVHFGIDAIWSYIPILHNITFDNVHSAYFIYQIGVNIVNNTVSNAEHVVELWGSYGWGNLHGSNNNFHNITEFSHPSDTDTLPGIFLEDSMYENPLFIDSSVDNYHLQTSSPLIDAGIDVGLPFAGLAPDTGAYETTTIPNVIGELAESYQKVPLTEYKNAGEQRRHALSNKFTALLLSLGNNSDEAEDCEKIESLTSAKDKLINDIWAKGDGYYGGNPNNDWITSEEEQVVLYEKVQETLTSIDKEISTLLCNS